MKESLGGYIRRLRKARHMTQEELGQSAGVTKAYISIIENEPPENTPRVASEKLRAFAAALGVQETELFNRAGYLPHGYRMVRDEEYEAEEETPIEYVPEWDELRAAGYSDLPPEVREEIKEYIAMRARILRQRRRAE